MQHLTDPDEFCTHCHRPVYSLYRLCPWCGEVWDSNTADDEAPGGQDHGKDDENMEVGK